MTPGDPATSDPCAGGWTDRLEIADVLYSYAACIDRRDLRALRALLADDLWAQYGNAEPLNGGDAIVRSIEQHWQNLMWQHHLLSVYHVAVEGDAAKALVYHTSHQGLPDDAGVRVLVGRYHNELVRTAKGWKISRLVLEILWAERRQDLTGCLQDIGGRGPQL
jgi:ketosteroid isomerase-like protein